MVFQNIPFFGESSIAYLYVRSRYGWQVEEYSKYLSTISTARLVGKKHFIVKACANSIDIEMTISSSHKILVLM